VFARAQHGIAARSELGRICTVEAVALALSELGERQETVDALVECVRRNNRAIDPGNARTTQTHATGTAARRRDEAAGGSSSGSGGGGGGSSGSASKSDSG
jgi:uncharacterized membrane protein YgcG